MSAGPSTEGRPSAKRDLLLETAFRLFYEQGYRAVGINLILAEAGLAKMTLYHHFKSKDDLIAAALDRRAAEIDAARDAALATVGDDPMTQLVAVCDHHEAWFRSPQFNGCAFIRAVAEYPDPASPVNQTVRRHKRKMLDFLEDLCRRLGRAQPEALAQQISLLLEGSIVRAHTFSDPEAARSAKAAILALVASAPPATTGAGESS